MEGLVEGLGDLAVLDGLDIDRHDLVCVAVYVSADRAALSSWLSERLGRPSADRRKPDRVAIPLKWSKVPTRTPRVVCRSLERGHTRRMGTGQALMRQEARNLRPLC